ncbi:MAG: hypothetical protein PHW69_00480 [Elusimicrobiaceae bacterium]|nr:hypothetical protein [Elusimicrobiaceae bacterium]
MPARFCAPCLKAMPCVTVSKKRLLPLDGVVGVKKGDRVRAGDTVASAELPGKAYLVNVANAMGVEPGALKDVLAVKAGDTVAQGAVLAENRPFFKWLKATVRSPVSGVVESVSEITGQLLLREPPRPLELTAFIDGEVTEVFDGCGATVSARASYIQGIFGVGGEACGELVVAAGSSDGELLSEQLTPAHKGKIVVGGGYAGIKTIRRARQLGVAGLVVGAVHDRDLCEIPGYATGSAVTGMAREEFVIVITEGFGRFAMADYTFRLLKARQGDRGSVCGATQIRCAAVRPEIIIPCGPPGRSGEAVPETGAEIREGDTVRIVREPYFGKSGTVAKLPRELVKIATESRVRVMEVVLENGEVVTVARSNAELAEK